MLTDKEKRVIISPLSFSVPQRKATKYRCKIKIQEVIQDMQFLIKHHDLVKKEFGIDVIGNNISEVKGIIEKEIPSENDTTTPEKNQLDDDPDML